MSAKIKGAEKANKVQIIVAVPNEWLMLPVGDILSAGKESYKRAQSLQRLYQMAEKYTRCIIIIDIFAYSESYKKILEELETVNPSFSLVALIGKGKVDYLDSSSSCYLIPKEDIDTRLIPAVKRAHKDQMLVESIFRFTFKQEQSPTLIKKEVNLMQKEKANIFEKRLGRRTFLKGSAAAAAVAGVAATAPAGLTRLAEATPKIIDASAKEEVFTSTCRSNCMYGCSLKAHVRDGIMYKVSVSPYPEENYTSVCLKGLSHVQRTYSPHRVKYPMRRVGERGSGQWERISWEEAINEIGEKLNKIRDEHGGQSIVFDTQSGNYGYVHGVYAPLNRLANCFGGTKLANTADVGIGHGLHRVMGCGDWLHSNEPKSLLDAKVIFIWGTNPVFTAPHVWRYIQFAKEQGAKVICIDPMKSATAHKSSEYVKITPCTDGYLALAMSNYIIENNLMDRDFLLNRANAPFLVRRDNGEVLAKVDEEGKPVDYYVWDENKDRAVLLSETDGATLEGSYVVDGIEVDTAFTLLKNHLREYTTAKAQELTGIPEQKIVELAKLYATGGPVSVNITYGLDHYLNGHLAAHAIGVLAAITGNMGKPGAGFTGVYVQALPINYAGIYFGKNPVPANTHIPQPFIFDLFRDQAFMGKSHSAKAIISASSNIMSNLTEQNRWFEDVFPNLEYWVVLENAMTDSAMHADMVLPAAFWFEVNDVRFVYNTPYFTLQEKAIEPLYESKSDIEIAGLIAHAMGYGDSFPKEKTDIDWAKVALDNQWFRDNGITWESLKEKKIIRSAGFDGKPVVQGGNGKFATPHGRVMIYWENPQPRINYGQDISDIARGERLPYYREPNETISTNPLYKKYPLVYIQEHSRFRVHSQWFDVPLLRELDPEPVAKMSRKDAKSRSIRNGDIVEVFNDRGHAVVKAVIDDSMAPGVISIPKGWQRNQFIAGCYQEMTNAKIDPMAVCSAYYDSLVDVRKWNG